MKALSFYVILKKGEQTKSKIGNIEITETQDESIRFVVGEVVSCGSDIKGLSVGDSVTYDKRMAHDDWQGNIIIKADAIAYIN